jgi:hypothetical protein
VRYNEGLKTPYIDHYSKRLWRIQKMKRLQCTIQLGLYLLLSLSVLQSVNAGNIISDKYDRDFKNAAMFLPTGTDWRYLKAQCYQESRLNPLAVSPVGAMGLCQFMPVTAREMEQKHKELNDFWLPEVSIRAAGLYMGKLNRFWSAPRPVMDRYKLALASYNAGQGNVLKAQVLSGGANDYITVISALPEVTGHHSKETIDYVQQITEVWYVQLILQ